MSASEQTLHDLLCDESIPFGRRLRFASSSELDYWEGRQNPPNLSRNDFVRLVRLVPDNISNVKVTPRISLSGPHGLTGEEEVFKFEFNAIILGSRSRYFLKGYFFDKGNRKGVAIQSFRLIPVTPPRSIRSRR